MSYENYFQPLPKKEVSFYKQYTLTKASLAEIVKQYNAWKEDHPSLTMDDVVISNDFEDDYHTCLKMSFSYTAPNKYYDIELEAYNAFMKHQEEVKRKIEEKNRANEERKKARKEYLESTRLERMKQKLANIVKRAAEDPTFNLDRALESLNKKFKQND